MKNIIVIFFITSMGVFLWEMKSSMFQSDTEKHSVLPEHKRQSVSESAPVPKPVMQADRSEAVFSHGLDSTRLEGAASHFTEEIRNIDRAISQETNPTMLKKLHYHKHYLSQNLQKIRDAQAAVSRLQTPAPLCLSPWIYGWKRRLAGLCIWR